jgi:hypothetical protein
MDEEWINGRSENKNPREAGFVFGAGWDVTATP